MSDRVASTPTSDTTPDSRNANRPVTSKPRGVCAYYKTDRGCYAGDRCKFLHGETERLTPYDKSKVCHFQAAGYCRRGDKCWFLHVEPNKASSSSRDPPKSEDDEHLCSICYDKPITYGLLVGCSHVFCLQCIKSWRGSEGKSSDMVEAGTTKTCPMCRTSCRFVTPSSQFYNEGDPKKAEIIERYKSSMARIKCRYFEKSRPNKPFCPFGKECFYKHESADGTPYVFEHGADYYIGQHRSRQDSGDFVWESETEGGFDAMLITISRVIRDMSSRDMQRAVLSSVAAVFGADTLPPMYRLEEVDAEEQEEEAVNLPIHAPSDQPEPEPEPEEPSFPFHTQDDWQPEDVVISPPPEEDVGTDLSISEHPTSPRPPSSTATSTLDPTAAVFIPSYLDNLRVLPLTSSTSSEQEVSHLERVLRGLEEQVIEEGTATSNATLASQDAAPGTTEVTARDEPAVHDSDPPFMTDGRGRVVWSNASSSRGRDGRRGRATSSSATALPHSKSSIDLLTTEESSDEVSQHDTLAIRPSSSSRQLTRRRSVPIVGASTDAEFVTDGRGRVVSASNHH